MNINSLNQDVYVITKEDGTIFVTTNVTGTFLPLSGGTMTGPLILADEPVEDFEAATKAYADNLFVAGANAFPGNAIFTSEGDRYPLAGLTDRQRGDQLVLAIANATNNAGVVIMMFGGTFDCEIIWEKRETSLIGFGRSKLCEIVSTTGVPLTLNTEFIMYNSVFQGFSLASLPGGTFDALRVENLGIGVAIPISQVELNIHIHASTRDAVHLTTGVSADNLLMNLKMTSNVIDIVRYSFYSDASGDGVQATIMSPDADIYLDTNSVNHSIIFSGVDNVSATKKLISVDAGTNNSISCPSYTNSFREDLRLPIIAPNLHPPHSKLFYYGAFDRTTTIIPDFSRNQLLGTKMAGTVAVEDTSFGNFLNFNTGDAYYEVADNAALDTSEIVIGFMIRIDVDQNMDFIRRGNLRVRYDTADKKIKTILNIGGTNRANSSAAISTGEFYLIIVSYDGATNRLRVNQVNADNTISGALLHTGVLRIGAFSNSSNFVRGLMSPVLFYNDSTDEVIRAIETHLLTGRGGYGSANDVVIKDRSNGNTYRLKTTAGVLGVDQIT